MGRRCSLRRSWVVPFLVASAFACRSPAAQGPQRVIGVIDAGAGLSPLTLPDTVHAGMPFAITVTTFGGACDQADGADVQTSDLSADVTPYDLLPPPSTVCIQI